MPGTNAGTGHPIYIRCWNCRRNRPSILDRYAVGDKGHERSLVATGRTRPRTHRGARQLLKEIEYRCTDCGHGGWTSHLDAERLLNKLLNRIYDDCTK